MNEKKPIFGEGTTLFDGAIGSQLLAAGLKLGEAPEAWNLEHPEIVRRIHHDYFEAGADVIQTNTFGGNRIRLEETKCEYTVEEVCAAGARNALAVCPENRLVAGNLGPTGLAFPPVGTADESELLDVFAEQAAALSKSGVHLLSVETMSDLREARAALLGAQSACQLPVIVSMTFRSTRRGFFTIMGDPATTSMRKLREYGAFAVGANCTLSSAEAQPLAIELKNQIAGPIIVQPNAGSPQVVKEGGKHQTVYPEGPKVFADNLDAVFRSGIEFVGGCCGTTPAHISELATLRERYRK